MFQALIPVVFLLAVIGGTSLAIVGLRRRVQRELDNAVDYAEGDVETDNLVECKTENCHVRIGPADFVDLPEHCPDHNDRNN